MSAEADAFIGIPGGFGTLEELLEMVTWQQLGLHTKPVGIYNMAGYYDHLLDFFDHAVEEVRLLMSDLAIVPISNLRLWIFACPRSFSAFHAFPGFHLTHRFWQRLPSVSAAAAGE